MTAKKTAKEQSFEKALARLEEIVEGMEEGNMPLDKMIAQFEEGQALVKQCSEKLNEVERRIEVLVKKGDEVVEEPFDDGEAEEDELF